MKERLGKVPLERALSKLGRASRRETRELILAGKLTVNGRTVKDPWFPVTPETDRIEVAGQAVERTPVRTIMMYKPRGIVAGKFDEKGRKTIFDILPPEYRHFHPVGYLDAASTGLLLLTSDTRLSDFLTDPIHAIPRTYVVTIEGQLLDEEIKDIEKGITDERELLKPSRVILRKASCKESHFLVEWTEGKDRDLRRIFSFFGHRVRKLKRIALGPLSLGELESGGFRPLSHQEMEVLNGLRQNKKNF